MSEQSHDSVPGGLSPGRGEKARKRPRNLMGLVGLHGDYSQTAIEGARISQSWQEPGAIHRMYVRMKSSRKQVSNYFSRIKIRPRQYQLLKRLGSRLGRRVYHAEKANCVAVLKDLAPRAVVEESLVLIL